MLFSNMPRIYSDIKISIDPSLIKKHESTNTNYMSYTINKPKPNAVKQIYGHGKVINIVKIKNIEKLESSSTMENINYRVFLNSDEFKNYSNEEDKLLCTSMVNSLFDYLPLISLDDIENNKELDDNFNKYLKITNDVIQYALIICQDINGHLIQWKNVYGYILC